MRARLTLIGVAQMLSGVCIGGYANGGVRSVRPVLGSGDSIPWKYLQTQDGTLVEPFTEIEIDLAEVRSVPPHTEDILIHRTGNLAILRRLGEDESRRLTQQVSSRSLDAIFETEIHDYTHVLPGTGIRSLGMIRVERIHISEEEFSRTDQRNRYRIGFRDATDTWYCRPVTDIAFREFCRRTWNNAGGQRGQAAAHLKYRINAADEIYLRIGLSRPFSPDDRPPACYLFVTGIYTFPSYLEGRWSDYYPRL